MRDDDPEFWDFNDEVYNAIRAAELAAEGAALRARAWAALSHRVAFALLGSSLLMAAAMHWIPFLRPWSGQAGWMVGLGLLCYLAIAAIAFWSRPKPAGPEIHELRKIRHQIAALYVRLQQASGRRPNAVLLRILAEAVTRLDDQLIPALRELVEKRDTLRRDLRRFERGQIRAPSAEMMQHLRGVLAQYEAGIDECLQHAADAYGTLIRLLQMNNDDDVANRARAWADDLMGLHDAMLEVLRGADEPLRADGAAPPEQPGAATREAQPEVQPVERDPTSAEPIAAQTSREELTDKDVEGIVKEALGYVRERALGRLGRCSLISFLPCTIAAALRERRNGHVGAPTSLEQAEAVREILIAAIDRLKPRDENPNQGGAGDWYRVVRLMYLESRTTEQIEHIVGIGNRTVFRYRDNAVEVMACDLRQREERHALGGSNGHDSN
jgi:hypothetical protein